MRRPLPGRPNKARVRRPRGSGVRRRSLIGVFLTHPPLGNASAALRDGGPQTCFPNRAAPRVQSRTKGAEPATAGIGNANRSPDKQCRDPIIEAATPPAIRPKLPSPSRVTWRKRRVLGLADMQSAATPTRTRRKDRGQQPPGDKTARTMRDVSGQVGETCDVFVYECARMHAQSRRPACSQPVVGAAHLSRSRTSPGARGPRRFVPLPVPG